MSMYLPTILLANIIEVQYWHGTNAPPIKPITNLSAINEAAELTNAAPPTARAPPIKIVACNLLGPNFSQRGPRAKRTKMVPRTLVSPDVLVSFRVMSLLLSLTIYSRAGTMANHPRKARKNDSQLKWKALNQGRWHENSFI